MNKFLIFLFFLASLCSCSNKQNESEVSVLDQEKFTKTLQDIHILDAAFRQKVIKEDYPNQKLPAYYDQVFKKHGINRAEFDSAYSYYSHHPELMSKINKEIENRIRIMESELGVEEDVLN